MEEIQVYKANLKSELQLIVGLLIVGSVLIALYSRLPINGWVGLGLLLLSILVYNLFCSRLAEIQIDDNSRELTLIHRNYLTILKSASYSLKEIKFTYKRRAISLRGGVKNVCSLFFEDKFIVDVIPDRDGWDDSEVHAFVSKLSHLGVERKFVGYTLKDVVI